MTPIETALIVTVPEAEPAVAEHRARLDTAAGWGVPAHITVLYPFLPPDRVDDTVLAAVRDIVAATPRFELSLATVGWFGETVVYLTPQPEGPFRELTAAVWRRFPQAPPYGGAYDDVVPHLTVGHDAPVAVLTDAADAVAPQLPIRAPITTVRLICGSPGVVGWPTLAEFPLGER